MKRKDKIKASMFSLLALLMLSCASNETSNLIPTDADLIPVKVMVPEQIKSFTVLTVSGQLTTDNETILSFKTGGVVDAVMVREGDIIKKGQLLAILNLTEINSLVSQVRQGFEKAQRDVDRTTILYNDSVATLEQLQNARTNFSVAKEQLETASFNRTFSEIRAPANGYVLHKFVNAGQIVGAGMPILISNDAIQEDWILRASVSDKQWTAIELQDKAKVHVDAFPGKSFDAWIIRKSERSDPLTGTFTVDLKLKGDNRRLATGMFASVQISSRHTSASWDVPYESVLDANGNEGFVFVTNDNKIATRQSVTIESFNGNIIRISKGLENVEALIVSGSAYLSDGSSVEIIK